MTKEEAIRVCELWEKEKRILSGKSSIQKILKTRQLFATVVCGVRRKKLTGRQNFVIFFETFFKVDKVGKKKINFA